MDYTVVLQNGEVAEIEDAEVELDLVSNSLTFKYDTGTFSRFYWPFVAFYVGVPEEL